jgi:hypothetical protein
MAYLSYQILEDPVTRTAWTPSYLVGYPPFLRGRGIWIFIHQPIPTSILLDVVPVLYAEFPNPSCPLLDATDGGELLALHPLAEFRLQVSQNHCPSALAMCCAAPCTESSSDQHP